MARAGQAATETIIILGVALVVVLMFIVLSTDMLKDARVQQNYDDASTSVQTLAEAADSVYAQGEGATRKVMTTLPGDTIFGDNYTYIGRPPRSPLASQTGININMNGTDVHATAGVSLVGQFPSAAGKYPMRVTSRGAYVEIYPFLVDVDKHSITITMAQDETRSSRVVVTRVSSEVVEVEPVQNWGFEDVTVSFDPSAAFNASEQGSTITVSVSANGTSSGVYNSQLTLIAIGLDSGTTDTINIPLSVNVWT